MKTKNFFAVVAIMIAFCAAFVMTSCSGYDGTPLEGIDNNETPSKPSKDFATKVVNSWAVTETTVINSVKSEMVAKENGTVKNIEVMLPLTVKFSYEETIRDSKIFTASAVKTGKVENDMETVKDTVFVSDNREVVEEFGATKLNLDVTDMRGFIQMNGTEYELGYVRYDSIVAHPERTKVVFIENVDATVERDSAYMPHTVYGTAITTTGKVKVQKDFVFPFTFRVEGNNNGGDNQPEEPEQPEVKPDTIVFYTIIKKWLDSETWNSYIKIHAVRANGRENDTTYVEHLPFEFLGEAEKYYTTEDASASQYRTFEVKTTKGEFPTAANANGNYVRKISAVTTVKFSKFDSKFTSSHHEAYRYIAGKKEYFVSSEENIAMGTYDRSNSTIENGAKAREKNVFSLNIKFNNETYSRKNTVYVDFTNPTEPEEPEQPTDPEQPEQPEQPVEPETPAEVIPAEWGTITGLREVTRVFNDKTNLWETLALVETSKGYIMVNNFKTILNSSKFVSFAEAYDDKRIVSGAYKNGVCYPALIQVDANGWTSLAEMKNGTVVTVDMSDQRAVTTGIKNFKKDNSAKPTPFVQNDKGSIKVVNGVTTLTVNCFDVDGGFMTSFNISSK